MEIKKMLDKNGLEYYTGKIKQQIPKKTSDLTNDSNFIDNTYHDNSKQDTLVSGTNIKTINNESLLGSGNISIQGGGTSTDVKINGTSITSGDTANIAVEGTYNASTNKLMTKSEVDGYDASWIYTSTPSVADFNAFYNYVENGGIRVYVTSQYDDQINTELVEGVEIREWGDEKYISIYSAGDLLHLICDGTQVTKKDVQLFERSYNKVTSLSSSSSDNQYPSAKCVYDNLATKQAALVSGTNIKTINNTSILGSGNISLPQVTDSYSASTTDSYSCNYINGLTGKILYENPSGTSSSFSLSEYWKNFKEIEVYFLAVDWLCNSSKMDCNSQASLVLATPYGDETTSIAILSVIIQFSDTTVSFTKPRTITFDPSYDAPTITASADIKVTKVIGYR